MKLADIVKDKKKNRAYCPAEEKMPDDYRIPTGIFPFDLAIAGGLPLLNPCCFYGEPHSGKSTVCLKAVAKSQQICWSCFEYLDYCTCGNKKQKFPVWVHNEDFDELWAHNHGVDLENLYRFQSIIGEECVDVIYDSLNADDVGLVVLDSISNLVPDAETTESAMKNHVGGAAKLQATLMRKVQRAFVDQKRAGEKTAFVTIGQVAANIGGAMWAPTEKIKCGYVARHAFRLTCRLSQLKTNSDFIDKETEMPIFGKFKSNTNSPDAKRQLFTLNGTSEFFVCLKNNGENYVGEVLDYKTLFNYADQVNLIDRNRWSSVFDDMQFISKKDMMQYWQENESFLLHLKKKVVDYYCKAEKGLFE